ncbi:MAG: hypothetical protein ABEJ34_04765 [Haloferacaceae archaeon]
MANKDLDWRPDGAMETYRGMEVWEYKIGPHHLNEGEVDGDLDLSDLTED